jgi:hypothetical protein
VNGTEEQEVITRSQNMETKDTLEPGSKNILPKTLVDPKKILLPPLHTKLGIMKQLVKALPKTVIFFKYLCKNVSHMSKTKRKEGFFR